ncbi:MAG: imidazole glycerol phosphate synthase subunit HisH [Gammaproteobacteria bacterium]|nr:imidazole glycerol phosphate synthase subunit HisH [Gammaproteobacteria bacterium]
MSLVTVIDYGMGNLRSVAKALEHVDPKANIKITNDAADIKAADHIVFPGQGAIGAAMDALKQRDLDKILLEQMGQKPFLGICLGLQVMMDASDEDGGTQGLGLLPGQVKRFPDHHTDTNGSRLKVPHMGWNQLQQTQSHPLWSGIEQGSRFYFVHSYYVTTDVQKEIAGTCNYGMEFVAAACRDNMFAVQFHPEKSAQAGLQLLQNFLNWDGQPA